MKISEKRQQELYNSIADPIEALRIGLLRKPPVPISDEHMFALQHKIWRGIHKTLKLEGPA